MSLELIETSTENLKMLAKQGVYVGATVDIARRAKDHETKLGYEGIIYYAITHHMERAKDELLQICLHPYYKTSSIKNQMKISNISECTETLTGYVYLIVANSYL